MKQKLLAFLFLCTSLFINNNLFGFFSKEEAKAKYSKCLPSKSTVIGALAGGAAYWGLSKVPIIFSEDWNSDQNIRVTYLSPRSIAAIIFPTAVGYKSVEVIEGSTEKFWNGYLFGFITTGIVDFGSDIILDSINEIIFK